LYELFNSRSLMEIMDDRHGSSSALMISQLPVD